MAWVTEEEYQAAGDLKETICPAQAQRQLLPGSEIFESSGNPG